MSVGEIRVVKILEVDKIVINKGFQDGIYDGMDFLVYDEGEDVIDPITKENLGRLENPKGRFKAIHIQEKMTTLLSKVKRPNKLATAVIMGLGEVDPERDLLRNIRVGDRVKITNDV